MIITGNDEEKRNTVYKYTTLISSALIIVIAIYFLTKLFMANPLEGEWEDEDGNINIMIDAKDTLIAEVPELSEGMDVKVAMKYTLDKEDKIISISLDDAVYQKIAEESKGQYTEEMLENSLGRIVASFNYNVEQGQLTLTEREYGEQMIFLEK